MSDSIICPMSKTGNMSNIDNSEKKEYKTKDYRRRATNKYRKKKYNEDEEYRAKNLESSRKNYDKNKENDEYKMKKKLYMREYRAKKKAEKLLISQQQAKDENQ